MKIIEYEYKYLEDVKDLLVELEEYIVSIDKDNLDLVDEIKNMAVCAIILSTKKLVHIAISAPIENQNTKKPVVIISNIRKNPATINQICHIIFFLHFLQI